MKFFTDVMIDLETLGTRPGSVIKQIGICAFKREDVMAGYHTALINVDIDSCLEAGLTVDGSTITWWLDQEDAARQVMRLDGIPLLAAMQQLRAMVSSVCIRDVRVWGNGPSFDVTHLDVASAAVGVPLPWEFRQVRCLRTLRDLFPDVERPRPEIPHRGDHDAKAQALWVQGMWNYGKPRAATGGEEKP